MIGKKIWCKIEQKNWTGSVKNASLRLFNTILLSARFPDPIVDLSILDFLRRDGWGEELVRMEQDDLDALADQPYARKPQKLTRRGMFPRCVIKRSG